MATASAAVISKTDAQGRVLDIHALRHSFCTMSGVSMQHAQRLMRHNTPAMAMFAGVRKRLKMVPGEGVEPS